MQAVRFSANTQYIRKNILFLSPNLLCYISDIYFIIVVYCLVLLSYPCICIVLVWSGLG